jgi:hypothetical protein
LRNADRALSRERLNVTATTQELSALVAAARMALEAMHSAPEPPPAAVREALERVLSDFDRARDRLGEEPGRRG